MTEKEPKSHYRRLKAEPPLLVSTIKSKADINSTMEMILKDLQMYMTWQSQLNKKKKDAMQLEMTVNRADINTINRKLLKAE